MYAFLKATKPQFSFRFFSRVAGFSSPNFLKLVMDGKRNLSAESIPKFIKALKLSRDEADFFRNLIYLNQAQTAEERARYAEKVLRSKVFKKLHPLKAAQFAYYSHWFLVPIRELVDLPGFRDDPQWVAGAMSPPITPGEAAFALKTLQELGLIRRDASGRLVQTDAILSTGDEFASAALAQFHREMIQKGAESMDRFPSPERDISSLTIGLSPEGAKRVKQYIQKMRKEILAIALDDQDLKSVHQVNFQFFPVARDKGEP